MTTTPGPRTKAGQKLLDELMVDADDDPMLVACILAIEAESRNEVIESLDEAEARADVDGLVAALRTIEGTLDDIIRYAEAANAPEQSAFAAVRIAQLIGMKAVVARALHAGDKAEAPPGANIPQFWSADK